jgi:hypothetical protein
MRQKELHTHGVDPRQDPRCDRRTGSWGKPKPPSISLWLLAHVEGIVNLMKIGLAAAGCSVYNPNSLEL